MFFNFEKDVKILNLEETVRQLRLANASLGSGNNDLSQENERLLGLLEDRSIVVATLNVNSLSSDFRIAVPRIGKHCHFSASSGSYEADTAICIDAMRKALSELKGSLTHE